MDFADSKKWLNIFRFFWCLVAVLFLMAAGFVRFEAVPAVKNDFRNTLAIAKVEGHNIDKRALRRSAIQQLQLLNAVSHVSVLASGLSVFMALLLLKAPVLLASVNMFGLLAVVILAIQVDSSMAIYFVPVWLLLAWLASQFLRASTVYQRRILHQERIA